MGSADFGPLGMLEDLFDVVIHRRMAHLAAAGCYPDFITARTALECSPGRRRGGRDQIAIPAIADETCSLPCLDLLMSSVVLCALSGDPATAIVWAYALRRHRSNSRARNAPPVNRSINASGGAQA